MCVFEPDARARQFGGSTLKEMLVQYYNRTQDATDFKNAGLDTSSLSQAAYDLLANAKLGSQLNTPRTCDLCTCQENAYRPETLGRAIRGLLLLRRRISAMAESSQQDIDAQLLNVNLSERSYAIHIGRGLLGGVGKLLRANDRAANHAILVFDSNVAAAAEAVAASLQAEGFRTTKLPVPSGEQSKSVAQIAGLWQAMLDDFTDRGSVVVAVGGGVVGDLAGFAAATFARGLPLVQVPTTLLSQVDSSVGGKTGINLPGTKNIVGAFWQPSLVAIDIDSLKTLPRREFVSGLAEVAKYGVIMQPELFEYLESQAGVILEQDAAALQHIVAVSCECKARVVQEDERETTGRRAILNYGHTFAHAIEAVAGYGQFLHGEAVAMGMHMAAVLSHKMGRVPREFVERQEALLTRLELPTRFAEGSPELLWEKMQHDKKVQHGRLRFVLPTRLGHVELVPDIGRELVLETLLACR